MQIENEITVAAPIEAAWMLLNDIPAIAPCLPGATLTAHNGDDYDGTIRVKVGPISAEYAGTATVLSRDVATRTVTLSASGRDTRGAGNASADIVATMMEDGGHTRVTIVTELTVSGKVAQFGRGVMADVSKKLMGQFADCVGAKLAGHGGAAEPSTGADTERSPDPVADEAATVDLLDLAGGAVTKRVAGVVALILVGALLVRLLRRRSSD